MDGHRVGRGRRGADQLAVDMATDQLGSLHYRSYVLRFWEERASGCAQPIGQWRFSLEDPHSGARLGFADVDQLIAFLKNQIQMDVTDLNHNKVDHTP